MHVAHEERGVAADAIELADPLRLHPLAPIVEITYTPVEPRDLPIDDRLCVGPASRLVAFVAVPKRPRSVFELAQLADALL